MPTDLRVRLAHFSDIHVNGPHHPWLWSDCLTKRLTGLINARLGRGRRFREVPTVLHALAAELNQPGRFDGLIFSGDATTLGFRGEMERAAALLPVNAWKGRAVAVPGNHDYYTRGAASSGAFESCFADWQVGQRPTPATYPFVARIGHLSIVAVNSATANLNPADSSGEVGLEQLARLRTLFRDLPPGPRILVTHYPVARADGSPEPRSRRLRDLPGLSEVAREGKVALWLHGHRHDAYSHEAGTVAPYPVVCAGSATQPGQWSFHDYLIEGDRLSGTRHTYDPQVGRFFPNTTFAVRLSGE
jgi:3',5'-cyclic AMP phosphodiesterase CpdA